MEHLCAAAFGDGVVELSDLVDVNQGRGAFSTVIAAALHPTDRGAQPAQTIPATVVAKWPIDGPNGQAAIDTGACGREALAYRDLLINAPIATPTAYTVQPPESETGDGSVELLLQDLTGHRAADQIDGLGTVDAIRVSETLATFHRAWADDDRLASLPVRRNTLSVLPMERLQAGLRYLETDWTDEIGDVERSHFAGLLDAADGLIQHFGAMQPTLCHGDPRADNLVFDDDNHAVLFDWQQIAVQFGEADLAWLAATSLVPEIRRSLDRDLVSAYGGDFDRYRLGMALPGMAVLLLAQRDLTTTRARRFVGVSLQRIAAAIGDLEVATLGHKTL